MLVVLHFAARAKGKKLGRPDKAVDRSRIAALRRSGTSWRNIAVRLEVGEGTVRRAAKECAKNPKDGLARLREVAMVRKDKDNKSKNDATVPELEALVSLGCDKSRLLGCLQTISGRGFGLDDWRELTGKDLRSLKGAINRFRQCAKEIASINKHTFGLLLLQMGSKDLRLLPERLQIYAAHLEATTKDSGPRKHPEHHAAKFFLVKHVKERTRRWCDEEVSALIDAVRDKTDRDKTYDAAAHKDWRRKNYDRLLKRFRPPSGLPPPPNAR